MNVHKRGIFAFISGGIFRCPHRGGAVRSRETVYDGSREKEAVMPKRRLKMLVYREVLRLHFELGKSYAAIAEVCGISTGGDP